MEFYRVYKIINSVNNKIYIGRTKTSLNIRINNHFNYAINKGGTNLLSKAIRAYGKDKFSIVLLCRCRGLKEADDMERLYIKKYSSNIDGYNLTSGGTYFEMNLDSKNKSAMSKFKKVYQYSLNGDLIAKYDSLKEASNKTGLSAGNISSVCRGKRYTSGGYQFRFCENINELNVKKISERHTTKKPVLKINNKNMIVQVYNSIAEASKKCNVQASSISEACSGKRKTAGGFLWEYFKESKND